MLEVMLDERGTAMSKLEEVKVRTVTIPLVITISEKKNEASMSLIASVKGDGGRIWTTSSGGTGKNIDDACDDFQAQISRNPLKFSSLVSRAIKGSQSEVSEPDTKRRVAVSSKVEQEITEGKQLKELIARHNLKVKFPFGATKEVRKKIVMDAIAAKGISTAKKEAF